MRGLSDALKLAKRIEIQRTWKKRFISDVRDKFPEVTIEGFIDDGFIVTLPDDSRTTLEKFQKELDCVFQIYRPAS